MAEPGDARLAIGIDLGTANSRVGIWLDEENRFQLISDDDGYQSTPCYVAFTETERLIGGAAKDQVSRNPANTVFDAKRLIGRNFSDLGTDADKMHVQWPFRVARGVDDKPMIHVEYKGKEKVFSAVDMCSMILGKLKDLAEVYSSSVVNEACVSVPHCFTSAQRQATRNACSLAGFESVTLVNEPVCAALACTLNTIGPSLGERKVMIFDLGGGSLDVTLFSIEEGVIEVKATSGDSQLGGEDFDLRLLHHFIQEIKQKYERDITSHPRVMRRLKQQVERVKVALSSEVEATIQIDSLLEDFNFYSNISRACFEEMNMDLFEACIKRVEECLQRAELDKVDVHEVVLIGGSSRIPKVQELLAEFFNDKSKLNKCINPDEAVVCGAAARAGISRGCTAFTDYLVVDVIPMALGLETVGGAMHVMHPRNSSIPKSSEQLFTTVHDDQPGIFIQVYEGENSQTCDNMLIATIELHGIPPASRGVPQILVRFDIDAYGILTVSAKDITSGAKVEIHMDQEVDIDRAQHDDELRQRLPIQVFHPSSPSENRNDLSSWLGPHESSSVSESSPHEFSEPFSTAIESTSQEVSEPPEAYKSRNSADSRSQEFSEPSPAFEPSNAVDSGSQEICEPSAAFEASNIVESRSQEISEPSESSNTVDSESQEFFESPQAFESSSSVESISLEYLEPPVAYGSSDTIENSSQEFPEPLQVLHGSNRIVETSKSQEFSEPLQVLHESNSIVEASKSQEFSEPLQVLHESNSIVETRKSQEFSAPQASESSNAVNGSSRGVSLVQEILDTVHVITPVSDFRTHKRECSTFIRRVNMLVPLFEEFRDLEFSLSEEVLACFNFLETALNTARDLILLCSKGSKLWLILEERKVAEQFLLLNTALIQALDKLPESLGISDEVREQVDLVHSQLKRSKALEDAVDAQLNAELVSILDEPNERSPDQLTRLAELFKLDTASALRKEFEALDGMTKEKAPGFVNMRGFDQIFGLLSDLRNVFPLEDLEQREYSKPSGAHGSSNVVEGSSQEFSAPPPAPSNSSNSLEGRSQEFSAQPPQLNRGVESSSQEISVQPPQVNRGAESRSQEFAAQPPRSAHSSSNSIDGRSLECSEPPQVKRDEKIKSEEFSAPPPPLPSNSSNSLEGRSQEFSAQPPQVNRGVESSSQEFSVQPPQVDRDAESRSQEFAAQPPRSPYSSSNSIDGRSFECSEPPQVQRDEKNKSQEFSAQPPQVDRDAESRSQEFAAQPPRSPYSSSNSIDGRSLEYSEPPQVKREEKIKSQEFSAPQPTYKSSRSFEGRPTHEYSEAPQVHRSHSTFGSRSSELSEPLPSHSSSSTPERSQEFPEYSSKPDFPEHSRGLEYKAWNGLEGKLPEPSEPLSAHRMSSPSGSRRHDTFERSPSYRSSSTSEASSAEFSGSGPLGAHGGIQNPVSDPPGLRRSATSADEPPRPENARSASCPQIRPSDSIIEDVVKKYTWNQVLDMTNDLTKTIGKGGFGAVYSGKLENEKEVAVKILDASSQQGITEFLNEVNLLKRVNHVNLVRLLGYCLDEKQVLIYEFAEEGSIWDHLQGGGKSLDWKTRLSIALQSACGLEYLHTGCHPRIIHRDIKSQNILLTKGMVAKVADFGLSKLGADQDNVSKTHVTTMVKGTLGYLDPEYLKTGQLTEKSDVYSFGVVMLEIITGRKPIQTTDRKGFIGDWVEEHYNSSSSSSRGLKSVADPALGGHFNSKALRLVLNVAKDCLHPCGMERPEMTEVVHVLRKAQMIEHDEKKSSKWLPFL